MPQDIRWGSKLERLFCLIPLFFLCIFSSNQDDSIFLNILAHYAKRPSVCVFVKTCQNIAPIIQWVIAQNATASTQCWGIFRAGALQRGFRDLFHPRSNILWRLNSPNIGEIELLLFHILHTKTELLQTNCNEHTATRYYKTVFLIWLMTLHAGWWSIYGAWNVNLSETQLKPDFLPKGCTEYFDGCSTSR